MVSYSHYVRSYLSRFKELDKRERATNVTVRNTLGKEKQVRNTVEKNATEFYADIDNGDTKHGIKARAMLHRSSVQVYIGDGSAESDYILISKSELTDTINTLQAALDASERQ